MAQKSSLILLNTKAANMEYKIKATIERPNAREGTDWDVFCFFRDAETVGLGNRS